MSNKQYEDNLGVYLGKTFEELEIILGKTYAKDNKGRKNKISKDLFSQHFQSNENLRIAAPTIVVDNDGDEKLEFGISFPAFSMGSLVKEDWEFSTPKKQIIDKQFLFFFWKLLEKEPGNNKYRLEKIREWSFPEDDVEELKNVWEKTILEIQNETFEFPKSTESRVSHVRPHARDGKDFDKSITSQDIPKRCFWLNKTYITDEVYKK